MVDEMLDAYETDFSRLVKLLTIRADAVDLMTELAIQAHMKMAVIRLKKKKPHLLKR
jgi:hypothetical protein